jgi:hypothetical protein
MFTLLLATLPTQPNAVRLRIWRNLRALGAPALRDGAYLLPQAHVAAFDALAQEVTAHGGSASVLTLTPRDATQSAELHALFDRRALYAQWRLSLEAARAELPALAETAARRRLRSVAETLQALRSIDYFPGPAASQAAADLDAVRLMLERQLAPDEPRARGHEDIAALEPRRFVGKRWATRARPWVDRLACAWFVRRFIDAQAVFVWLKGRAALPRGAIGFDFDGAQFSHVGARVSFEVMVARFGFEADERLRRVGAAVHVLDAGGIQVPEAAGLEMILAGLRELHADDDALLAATLPVFDGLYAGHSGGSVRPANNRPNPPP